MRQRLTEEELISAYLDGEMGSAERAAFEARLTQDVALRRRVLATRLLVQEAGKLPTVDLPRNFILPLDASRARPSVRGLRPPFLRLAFRFGSVAATIVFVALVASEALLPTAPAAQPEMAVPAAVPEISQPMAAPAQPAPPEEAYPPPAAAMPADEAARAEPAFSPRSAPQATQPQAADAPLPQADQPAPTVPLHLLLAALAFVVAAVLGILGWAKR